MKKDIIIILFLIAIAIFAIMPEQRDSQAANNDPPLSDSFLLDWSSNSYVPPGYQGKALAARNSLIRVVAATIDFTVPAPEKLFYEWKINGETADLASGFGQTVLEFKAAGWPGGTFEITCLISDSANNLLAEKNVAITLAKPQILLYDSFGSYAFKNSIAAKTDQKLRFLAVPFFFRSNNSTDIDYGWQFGGQQLISPNNQGLDRLTLSVPAGEITKSFIRQLNLSVVDKNDQLQRDTVNLNIEVQP